MLVRRLLLPLLFFVVLPLSGQPFSTTTVQLAHATGLRDAWFGYDVLGSLQTVTLEHYRSSEGGDLYAFADVLHVKWTFQ